jgi:hypothetical protein
LAALSSPHTGSGTTQSGTPHYRSTPCRRMKRLCRCSSGARWHRPPALLLLPAARHLPLLLLLLRYLQKDGRWMIAKARQAQV